MAKVKDVFGDKPGVAIDMKTLTAPDPKDIWASYDAETDSMTVFLTQQPVPGMNVYLGNDVYAIVDAGQRVVGFYLDAWERRQVPAHPAMREAWSQVRASLPEQTGASALLRLVGLWLVMELGHAGNGVRPHPTVA